MGVRLALAVVLLAVLSGCGARSADSYFMREQTDLNYIQKVAVLPFSNNTDDSHAGNRFRDITTTQILTQEKFDVVDSGLVDSALKEMAIRQDTPLDSPILKRLGQRLGVQAFMHGTVEDVGNVQQGSFSYPQISLTLKLIDSESSMLIWQATAHRHGYSVWDRIFDLDPQSGFQLTMNMVDEMLATIPK